MVQPNTLRHTPSTGKRPRPRWFGKAATFSVITLLLVLAAPSSATATTTTTAHGLMSSRKNSNNNDNVRELITVQKREDVWKETWVSRLHESLDSMRRKRAYDKPKSIQLILGDASAGTTTRHQKRRVQADTQLIARGDDEYRFSVDSPAPTFHRSSTMSPSATPTRRTTIPTTSTTTTLAPSSTDARANTPTTSTTNPSATLSATLTTTTNAPSNQDRQGEQPAEAVNVINSNNRPAIPIISKSTKAPSEPFQALKFAEVPVGFDVLLETNSQQDLEEMAQEAKLIMEEHLYKSFFQGFDPEEGVLVRSVDLTVEVVSTKAPDPQQRRRHLATVMQRSWERILQQSSSPRAITMESRGVAGFQVNRDAVDTEAFLDQVNAIINDSVQPDALMDLFRNSTSGLSDYRVAGVQGVQNTDTANEDDNDGPAWWAIALGFTLVAIMVASLVAYAYIFYKKHKKRQLRRKQFGVSGKSSPYKVPPNRGRGASVTPAKAASGHMMVNAVTIPSGPTYPMGGDMNSSSDDESSYKGLGSGSQSEDARADMFAKELRLAASLDRKAWDDFQDRREHFADEDEGHQGHPNSNYPSGNGVYRDLSGMEAGVTAMDSYGQEEELQAPTGAGGLIGMGDTVSIQSNSSFPYGDENDTAGYLPRKMYNDGTKNGILQDPESEAYMTSAGKVERDASNGGCRMTDSAESKLNPGEKPAKYSFLYHSNGPNADTEPDDPDYPPGDERSEMVARYGAEIASAAAVRGSPTSQSWSTNPRPGSSTENGTQAALRGSPQSSSWNSASQGIYSGENLRGSPGFESNAAVNQDNMSAGASVDESMMVTADILKEVQDLTQFVKNYEQKKESKQRGDVEREQGNASPSSRDYDSLIETVNSLQRVVNERSPERKTTRSPNESSQNSPQRNRDRGVPHIESMPSSDSDDETMESDRRLGITPFSVQRAAGYQNPAMQHSPIPGVSGGTMYANKNSPAQNQMTAPRNVSPQTPRFNNNASPQSKSGSLSSLRHTTDAILDDSISDDVNVPSDEFTAPEPHYGNAAAEEISSPPLRDPRRILPRQRSKNKGFNSTVAMFEAKPKAAIYPPNESWQYNY